MVNKGRVNIIGRFNCWNLTDCSIKMFNEVILFPFVFLLSLIGGTIILLFIEGELNGNILLFRLESAGIIIFLAKYVWSRWWKAEVLIERGWLFLKTWEYTNYIELLPRKIGMINDTIIKVIGDSWKFL